MAFTFTLMSLDGIWSHEFPVKVGYLFVVGYIFLAVFYIIIQNHRENIKDRVSQLSTLQAENKEQRETLKDHSKSLWKELSKVNIHAHNESVMNVFERFLMTQENVIAVELYNYYLQDGTDYTAVKINHSLGRVMENKDHNTILQHYYHIPKYTYEKFKAAQYMFQNQYFLDVYNGKKPDLKDKKPLINFFQELRTELFEKDVEKEPYSKEDVAKFALLILAAGDIEDWFQKVDFNKELLFVNEEDQEKEKALFEKSKTGILRGILDKGSLYTFSYKKKEPISRKDNRIYITKKTSVRGRPSILVITVENRPGLNDKQIMDSLIRLLEVEQSIEVEYNNR
ncbi:hypothetical protein [Halobacillus locisalis]|nr:hypothetical protein [Halobacillus locisalis]